MRGSDEDIKMELKAYRMLSKIYANNAEQTRTPLSENLFYIEQLITKAEKPQTIFDGIIADNRLVLVYFFGDWCPPCKLTSPEIDKVAKQFPSVIFLKVDKELFPELFQNIKSIPVIRIYKDGNRVYNEAGGKSESQLKQLIMQFQK